MELPKNWKVDCKDIETFDKVWKKFKPNNKETDPDRRYIFYRNRPSFPVCFYTAFTHVFTSESSFTEVSVEDVLREFEKDDSGKKALHSLVIGPFEDCHEKVLVITHLINV